MNNIRKYLYLTSFIALLIVGGLFYADFVQADGTFALNESSNAVRLNNDLWVKIAFFQAGEGVNVILDVYDADPSGTTFNILGSTDFLTEGMAKKVYSFEEGAFSVQLQSLTQTMSGWSASVLLESEPDFEFGVSNLKLSDTTIAVDGASTIIEWKTNIPVTSKIIYCMQMTCSDPLYDEQTTFKTDHLLTLEELEYSRIYNYRIVGVNEAGQEFIHPSGDNEWLTFAIGDPPLAPMDAPFTLLGDDGTLKVNFVTVEDSYAFIKYGLDSINEEVQPAYEYKVGLHSVELFDLIPNQVYKYQVVLVNRAGESSFSPVFTFRTSASPITVSNVSVNRLSDTSVKISWQTDGRCKGGVRYEPTIGESAELFTDIFAFSHNVTLVDLNPAKTYTYWTICVMDDGKRVEDDQKFILIALVEEEDSALDPEIERIISEVVERERSLAEPIDVGFSESVSGKILLQVEENGEAWYINPSDNKRYFLGRPEIAFEIMRQSGLGISNFDLRGIPIGLSVFGGSDDDGDLLSNSLEEALGTDPMKVDSDDDGFPDNVEIENGFNPLGPGRLPIDFSLASRLKGKILLQVESHGEAWYVNPNDGRRYYLGRPADAFVIMQDLGLGITNDNIRKIEVGEL